MQGGGHMSYGRRLVAILFLLLGAVAVAGGLIALAPDLPRWLAFLVGMNVLAFLLYGYDKAQARRDAARVPEAVLLTAAALGGTPGALVAMITLRHKTRKRSFRRIFFAIALAQALLLAWYWADSLS